MHSMHEQGDSKSKKNNHREELNTRKAIKSCNVRIDDSVKKEIVISNAFRKASENESEKSREEGADEWSASGEAMEEPHYDEGKHSHDERKGEEEKAKWKITAKEGNGLYQEESKIKVVYGDSFNKSNQRNYRRKRKRKKLNQIKLFRIQNYIYKIFTSLLCLFIVVLILYASIDISTNYGPIIILYIIILEVGSMLISYILLQFPFFYRILKNIFTRARNVNKYSHQYRPLYYDSPSNSDEKGSISIERSKKKRRNTFAFFNLSRNNKRYSIKTFFATNKLKKLKKKNPEKNNKRDYFEKNTKTEQKGTSNLLRLNSKNFTNKRNGRIEKAGSSITIRNDNINMNNRNNRYGSVNHKRQSIYLDDCNMWMNNGMKKPNRRKNFNLTRSLSFNINLNESNDMMIKDSASLDNIKILLGHQPSKFIRGKNKLKSRKSYIYYNKYVPMTFASSYKENMFTQFFKAHTADIESSSSDYTSSSEEANEKAYKNMYTNKNRENNMKRHENVLFNREIQSHSKSNVEKKLYAAKSAILFSNKSKNRRRSNGGRNIWGKNKRRIMYILEAPDVERQFVTPLDFVYFGVITMSTVGYGDYTPVTPAGKYLTMFIIVTCISFVGAQFKRLKEAMFSPKTVMGIIPKQDDDYILILGPVSPTQLLYICKGINNSFPNSVESIFLFTPLPVIIYRYVYGSIVKNTNIKVCINGGNECFICPSIIYDAVINARALYILNNVDSEKYTLLYQQIFLASNNLNFSNHDQNQRINPEDILHNNIINKFSKERSKKWKYTDIYSDYKNEINKNNMLNLEMNMNINDSHFVKEKDDQECLLRFIGTYNICNTLIPITLQLSNNTYEELIKSMNVYNYISIEELKYALLAKSVNCKGLFFLIINFFYKPKAVKSLKKYIIDLKLLMYNRILRRKNREKVNKGEIKIKRVSQLSSSSGENTLGDRWGTFFLRKKKRSNEKAYILKGKTGAKRKHHGVNLVINEEDRSNHVGERTGNATSRDVKGLQEQGNHDSRRGSSSSSISSGNRCGSSGGSSGGNRGGSRRGSRRGSRPGSRGGSRPGSRGGGSGSRSDSGSSRGSERKSEHGSKHMNKHMDPNESIESNRNDLLFASSMENLSTSPKVSYKSYYHMLEKVSLNMYYYLEGLKYNIYRFQFPECMRGFLFQTASEYLYQKYSAFLIGIITINKEIFLNPVDYIIGEENKYYYTSAFSGIILTTSLDNLVKLSSIKSISKKVYEYNDRRISEKLRSSTSRNTDTRNDNGCENGYDNSKNSENNCYDGERTKQLNVSIGKKKSRDSEGGKSAPVSNDSSRNLSPQSSSILSSDTNRRHYEKEISTFGNDSLSTMENVVNRRDLLRYNFFLGIYEVDNYISAYKDIFSDKNKPLLLICGWPDNIHMLLKYLKINLYNLFKFKKRRKKKIPNSRRINYNIIILSLHVPKFNYENDLFDFSNIVAFIRGSAMNSTNLIQAGLFYAKRILILNANHSLFIDKDAYRIDNEVIIKLFILSCPSRTMKIERCDQAYVIACSIK
ncbi:potassium channel, putative [Plasmodium ovale wallikeri]|uniref:Potassium channel, putative n=1 Tax=Plasmodium ovale wallikeri TaxID=864142 RepID=A0A1A8ZZ48_PLAOA|nr:potassium channel, putative [Plasmodium ovale wallikeri]